jgi:hypothetical protein
MALILMTGRAEPDGQERRAPMAAQYATLRDSRSQPLRREDIPGDGFGQTGVPEGESIHEETRIEVRYQRD